ncbi:MAG: FG-GAP repeat protein [Planctomycetes bacterium]|nr:FG-GAP repeat protein [Planctomycetota bacterium]
MHSDSIRIYVLGILASAVIEANASGQTELFTFKAHAFDDIGKFGFSVAGAGDVDGDGFADVVVGQPLAEATDSFDRGAVYLFSGKDGLEIYFTKNYDNQIGWSVCPMGDLSNSGHSDFAFGSAQEDYCDGSIPQTVLKVVDGASLLTAFTIYGPSGYGSSKVYFGAAIDGGADINGDGVNDLVMISMSSAGGFYRAISGATGADIYNVWDPFLTNDMRIVGDIDGDGLADVILCEKYVAKILSGPTANLIFSVPDNGFNSRVAPLGDINLDGIPDFAVTDFVANNNDGKVDVYSGSNAQLMYSVPALVAGGALGSSIDSIGDVNGDGIPDFAAGVPYANLPGIHEGGVQVHSGQNGALLALLHGKNNDDIFGYSVRGAGDVNGDGISDLIVGAPRDVEMGNWDKGTATVFSFANGLQQFGRGVNGCNGAEVLNTHAQPKVNTPGFDISCTNAPPSALGLALIGNVQIENGSDIFGIGITIYVDVYQSTELFGFDIYSSAGGFADVNAPIPNDPTLVGKTYFAQTIWLWPTGIPGCVPSPYYLSCSDGLAITIQQ